VTSLRGISETDPIRVQRARERKRLSRPELAEAINERLGRGAVSDRTISKIETGRPVEEARYWPVMVELGLADRPSLRAPDAHEAPYEWLKRTRLCFGIAPTTFCTYARSTDFARPMSRSTLHALESGERDPKLVQTVAISTAFKRCLVQVSVDDLLRAWARHKGPSIASAWETEMREALLVQTAHHGNETTLRDDGTFAMRAALSEFAEVLGRLGLSDGGPTSNERARIQES
jgi:DNA-binding XRE family transcriptional regulator